MTRRARPAPAQRAQERASRASRLPAHPAWREAAQRRATALPRPCPFFRPVGMRGVSLSRAFPRLRAAPVLDGTSPRIDRGRFRMDQGRFP